MTLQELGNLGEFVGSIAVLVTLIYLARQLHQRTDSARTESLNMALGVHVHQIAQLTATDESAELFRQFCANFTSLSLNEKGRIHAVMLDLLVSFNQVIRLNQAGMLDDEEFKTIRGTYLSILRTTGGRAWWEAYKHMTPPFLNTIISEMIDDPNIEKSPITVEQRWLFQ